MIKLVLFIKILYYSEWLHLIFRYKSHKDLIIWKFALVGTFLKLKGIMQANLVKITQTSMFVEEICYVLGHQVLKYYGASESRNSHKRVKVSIPDRGKNL